MEDEVDDLESSESLPMEAQHLEQRLVPSGSQPGTFLTMAPEIERQRAEAAEHEAHQRSIEEWDAKVKASELDHEALPFHVVTPQGASSMRVLPNVHEALRQNDPKMILFFLKQSSRRLHLRPFILAQSLQGLVQEFNLHHLLCRYFFLKKRICRFSFIDCVRHLTHPVSHGDGDRKGWAWRYT